MVISYREPTKTVHNAHYTVDEKNIRYLVGLMGVP
jgi:hypothetical protein